MKITIFMVTLFTLVIAPVAYSQNIELPALGRPTGPEVLPSIEAPALPTNSSASGATTRVDLGVCFAAIMEDVELPARTSGTLMELKIRKGDQVKQHSLVGSLDNRTAIVENEYAEETKRIADFQAAATEGVELAQATYSFASQRLVNNQRLYEKGAITLGELDESRLAAKEAQLAVRKAQKDREAAMKMASRETINVKVTQEKLQHYFINAPFDGDVMEVYKSVGEWVAEGETVARIVRMDKLQVQGSFSASQHNPDELMGRPVTVHMQIARGQTAQFTGKIYSVSLEQTANRRYRVWAEIENRQENSQWILRPQAEVTMEATLD